MTRPILRRDTRGASLVEYIILVGAIALFALAGYAVFGRTTEKTAEEKAACVAALDPACAANGSSNSVSVPSNALTSRSSTNTNGGVESTSTASSAISGTSGSSSGSQDRGFGYWAKGIGRGFAYEAWDTVKGLGMLAWGLTPVGMAYYGMKGEPLENPAAKTVMALGKLAFWSSPVGQIITAAGGPDPIGDMARGLVTQVKESWQRDPAELVGRGVFEVATIVVPYAKAKLAGDAAKVADLAKAGELEKAVQAANDVSKATDVAEATEAAEEATALADKCPGGVCMNGLNCFAAGTPIVVSGGALKPVEQIGVGDVVMARDPASGETDAEKVVRTFVTPDRPVVAITLEGDAAQDRLVATPEHPFWVNGRGFVTVANLAPGDEIRTLDGVTRVAQLESLPQTTTVYNFEVERAHTYFVGHTAAWVHNACLKPGDWVSIPRNGGKPNSLGQVVERYPNGTAKVAFEDGGKMYEKTISEAQLGRAEGPGAIAASTARKFGDPYVADITKGGEYVPDRLFSDWIPQGDLPSEGWKIHVSADPANSYEVADRVLPQLREMGVPHKVMRDPEAYARMTGTQEGKFITIYPRSPEEAANVANVLEGRLQGVAQGPVIPGERPLGQSGNIYTRYGGFTKSTVTDPATGFEVPDVRGQTSPPWVSDPFHKHGL